MLIYTNSSSHALTHYTHRGLFAAGWRQLEELGEWERGESWAVTWRKTAWACRTENGTFFQTEGPMNDKARCPWNFLRLFGLRNMRLSKPFTSVPKHWSLNPSQKLDHCFWHTTVSSKPDQVKNSHQQAPLSTHISPKCERRWQQSSWSHCTVMHCTALYCTALWLRTWQSRPARSKHLSAGLPTLNVH